MSDHLRFLTYLTVTTHTLIQSTIRSHVSTIRRKQLPGPLRDGAGVSRARG